MNSYSIKVKGVTSYDNVPQKYKSIPNTTIYQKNLIDLKTKSFNIEKIIGIEVELSITSGNKNENNSNFSILGYENFIISYSYNLFSKDVRTIAYENPIVGEVQYKNDNFKVNKVYATVTSLKAQLINNEKVYIETAIFLAPIITETPPVLPIINESPPALTQNYYEKNCEKYSESVNLNQNNPEADIIIDYDMGPLN